MTVCQFSLMLAEGGVRASQDEEDRCHTVGDRRRIVGAHRAAAAGRPYVAVGPAQPHIRDLSTSTSQPGANGSKPCSISQRTASRLRNDHHAWITSRSMPVPSPAM